MSTLKTAYYTQKDFEQIINKGISYSISMDILNTIRKLEDKVKQSTAISAATISHRHTHIPQRQQTHNSGGFDQQAVVAAGSTDWKKPKSLATTMVIKSSNPMNQMKLLLNKLSTTNYAKLKTEIMTLLESENLLTEEAGKEILGFLSKTKEFSMSILYMELYSALVEAFPTVFQPILDDFWRIYEGDLMNKIPGMAPDEENEEYLSYMKAISELRGQTIFLAHWCRHHSSPDQGVATINTLLRQIERTLTEPSGRNKTKIDEWTEQIYLWVKILGKDTIMNKDEAIWKQMEILGQMNIKEAPNMTSRSKFKYQEILKF